VELPADPTVVERLRAAGCVFAEAEASLIVSAARSPAEAEAMVLRRVAGLPLEQVVGWAELAGTRVAVEPGVFVPRHRSELLVREAQTLVGAGAVVLDLCCGSGAIGVAVAASVGPFQLHASDIDPAAVACARRNVAAFGGQVHEGDLYTALPADLRGRIDLVLANAPYVPTDEMATLPREARLYEPRTCLDGGGDGLDVVRRIVNGVAEWMAPGGHLIVESSRRQAQRVAEMMRRRGLGARIAVDEELEATVVVAAASSR
jgi:release factor glutamine methyltransferase